MLILKRKRTVRLCLILFAIGLCLLLHLSVFAQDEDGETAGMLSVKPEADDSGVYQISTAEELYWFAGLVNGTLEDGTAQNSSASAVLTNDISLNENLLTSDGELNGDGSSFRTWTPIGNNNSRYKGTFDGGGHTVTGLYINSSGSDYQGFAGYMDSGAKILNLKLDGTYVHGSSNVGSICGFAQNNNEIRNCFNSGTVKGYSSTGGICGLIQNGSSIRDCTAAGKVHASGNTAGGITASASSSSVIQNCTNHSAVDSARYAGGICASNFWDSPVSGCTNTGAVSSGANQSGGISGNCQSTISNCLNTGTVSGPDDTGGICGTNSSALSSCLSTGRISGGWPAGGICGRNNNGSGITDCYYLDTSAETGVEAGENRAVSVSGEKLASGEIAWRLNITAGDQPVWYQTIDQDPNPVLDSTHGLVYRSYEGCDPFYSNMAGGSTEPQHQFSEDGFCTVCGAYEPAGSEENMYRISNCGQLYWFAALVNGTLSDGTVRDTDADAVLLNDITINEDVLTEDGELNGDGGGFRNWTPIGGGSDHYTGTFDGAGHTVSGLYCSISQDGAGLIGYLGTDGEVKDLTLEDSWVYTSGGYSGGVCGRSWGRFTNCVNRGSVSGNNSHTGGICGCSEDGGDIEDCINSGTVHGNDSYVGGIVGRNNSGDNIVRCSNSGSIKAERGNAGGICGSNHESVNFNSCSNSGSVAGRWSVGGICGENNRTLEQCENSGEVTGSQSSVGGICGSGGDVKNSSNCGKVTGVNSVGGISGSTGNSESNRNSGDVIGTGYGVGGIAGDATSVRYCINSGTVTGSDKQAGGIAGKARAVTYCGNTGAVTGSYEVGGVCGRKEYSDGIQSCYNTGQVTVTTGDSSVKERIGGICGYIDRGSVKDCFYLEGSGGQGSTALDTVNEAQPRSGEAFRSGEAAYLLNSCVNEGEPVWYQNLDNDREKDELPVLDRTHGTVYRSYRGCVPVYSNTAGGQAEPEHQEFSEDGFCTACGAYEPAESEAGVYSISNAGQLYWFAGLVNGTLDDGTAQNLSADAVLKENITLNRDVLTEEGGLNGVGDNFRIWQPIGSNGSHYTGSFDGAGHTVSGMYIPTGGWVGFISALGEEGTIKNLSVSDSYISALSAAHCAGGICAHSWGKIEGCSSSATVIGNSMDNIGGICGHNDRGGYIADCRNSGVVEGSGSVGGIAGFSQYGDSITGCTNSGKITGSNNNVGGICGQYIDGEGIISDCINTGEVTGSKQCVGGICGSANRTVTRCRNSGAVTSGDNLAGGICGKADTGVTYCANTGSVTGTYQAGGIAGCVSYGGTILSCYNTGKAEGTDNSHQDETGGICGSISSGSVENCVYQEGSGGPGAAGENDNDAKAVSAEAFPSGEAAYLLNGSVSEGELIWYQNLDNGRERDELPVWDSGHGTVYCIQVQSEKYYSNDPDLVVVSVDLTWGDLSFTYDEGTWNPERHAYEGGGWTADGENGDIIALENKGNTAVSASYSYQEKENGTGVNGAFLAEGIPVAAPLVVPVGENQSVSLTLHGRPKHGLDKEVLGSVTVNIAAGGEEDEE